MSNMTCICNSRRFGCLLTFSSTVIFPPFPLSGTMLFVFSDKVKYLNIWNASLKTSLKLCCKFLLNWLEGEKKQQLNFYKKVSVKLTLSVFNSFPLFLSNSISLQISTPYYICRRKFYLDL